MSVFIFVKVYIFFVCYDVYCGQYCGVGKFVFWFQCFGELVNICFVYGLQLVYDVLFGFSQLWGCWMCYL